jgi:anti-sigma-K factor RskA
MAHNERFEELAALQALGVPLGGEGAEFARHLAECGVCAAIVEEGAAASAMLAIEAPPVAPRLALRARILDQIAAEAKGGVRPPVLSGAGETRRGFPRWALALAAALALLVLLVDDARMRREREELRSRSADLVTRLDSAQRNLARRDLQVRVLESEDVRVLFLGGKAPQPDARAKVFWSDKAKRGVLVAANLQPLPAGKQYELWVFAKGKPVAAGVFDVDPSGRVLAESSDLSAIEAAENFAVTVEPRGGVSAPTGPIVLVGAP